MTAGKAWRCAECGAPNADTRGDGERVGTCGKCYAFRPTGKAGRATGAGNRLRAGDTILGGYVLDGTLRPVRRTVGR